ncbi:MAG: UDP-N-acetylmuramoyl-tripeptide--D-alanyl-D-alanine ligase [Chitinophagaceae bacterium]|nr:UDP-N-acetylmuramoyl-tripeptide--D-alanyl-D-alanine ligase [Chitinophagaceae bacterium]
MQIEQLYRLFLQHPSVQTDTRKLKEGDIFFALKGPNFNGNLFAKQALEAGAAYAVVDEAPSDTGERVILTDDVLTTLQQLAAYHRRRFNIPFIAITGSNGKTTTKELMHAVLSSRYKTYTTRGNLNNHIGIPLTLLGIQPDAEMAIIEMGANHLKEIEGYCEYTAPTHGLITNCGKAHLEGFGSEEGVRKGKGELYDYLRLNEGVAFVMWDYAYLRTMSRGIPHIYTYGTADAGVTGTVYQSDPFLQVAWVNDDHRIVLRSRLVGDYNLPNVLASIAVGRHFGVKEDEIRRAIEAYTPSNSRSQLIDGGASKIILDAYNANPSSMRAAIGNFSATGYPNKILVLGAMMELGSDSMQEHRELIEWIKQSPWKEVVLVGGDFALVEHPFRYFSSSSDAAEWLDRHQEPGNVYLIKGSRSTQMEIIAERLKTIG